MKGKTTTFMLETSHDLCWGWVGESKVMWLSPLQRILKKRAHRRCEDQTLALYCPPWGLFVCPSPTQNKESLLPGELQPQTKLLRHFHGFSNLYHASPLNGAESPPSLPPVKCCLGLTSFMRVYFWCYYKQHWKKGRENGLSILTMVSNFVRTSAKTKFCPMF